MAVSACWYGVMSALGLSLGCLWHSLMPSKHEGYVLTFLNRQHSAATSKGSPARVGRWPRGRRALSAASP